MMYETVSVPTSEYDKLIVELETLRRQHNNADELRRQRDEALHALREIENWLSVSFITTPQDMAQSFEEMYWTARHAIAKATGEDAK